MQKFIETFDIHFKHVRFVNVGSREVTSADLNSQHLNWVGGNWVGGNWVGQNPHFRGPFHFSEPGGRFHFSEPHLAGHGPPIVASSISKNQLRRTLTHNGSLVVRHSAPWVSSVPLPVQPKVQSGSNAWSNCVFGLALCYRVLQRMFLATLFRTRQSPPKYIKAKFCHVRVLGSSGSWGPHACLCQCSRRLGHSKPAPWLRDPSASWHSGLGVSPVLLTWDCDMFWWSISSRLCFPSLSPSFRLPNLKGSLSFAMKNKRGRCAEPPL